MRRVARSSVAVLLAIALTGSLGASTSASAGIVPSVGEPALASLTAPTLAQLVGQKLVVRMSGTTPTADLLGRIKRGEIGGVILFGSNVNTRSQLIALTGKLRAAAALGGQPKFLVAVDQEGGVVKRIPWAPPTMSARQMGANGLSSTAQSQGAATATALRGLGINVNFAPVADVPASTASFMYLAGRTFSFSATKTARLANAFATGLRSGRVAATMKHFPGIGYATRNTDSYVVTIRATRTQLAPGLLPYRTAIANHIPLIMLSNATYPAYDSHYAAGWSPAIVRTLLRTTLGFTGVTITDSLTGTAAARGLSQGLLADRAAKAGTDMLLLTGSETSSKSVFNSLLASARAGSISATTLRASYNRILALKAGL
jgi:beta-N-acetylhexosaminidase